MSLQKYWAHLRKALAAPPAAASRGAWVAAIAVVVVTLLTATSVGVLVAARHSRTALIASGPRLTTPTPEVPPVSGANLSVSAPSKDAVWVLVEAGHLYRSTDQGVTWESRPLPASVGVRPSISFVDARQGWLLAPGSPATQCQEAHAELWHTADAGSTWQRLAARGIADAQCKERVYFATARLGFVTAWDDNHPPAIYSTVDGGASWLKGTLPDGPLFVTSGSGFVLRAGWIRVFGSTAYLEASGPQHDPNYPRDFIFTSRDGGATWSWKQKMASPYTFMVTETRWLQLAPDVEETVNGGQAFGPFKSDFHAAAPYAVFADDQVGYASDGGALQRTLDGGSHWAAVAVPGGAPLPSPSPTPTGVPAPTEVIISAPTSNSNVVWALVRPEHLYLSTDRGDTWQLRRLPPVFAGGAPIEISFADATNGWLSTCPGSMTTLWHTTDGARSWQAVTSSPAPGYGCLSGLSFIDATHGFISDSAVDRSPVVYRTSDAGATWSGATLPDPPGFQTQPGFSLSAHGVVSFGKVEYITAYGLQASGGKAYVFRSADGGAGWSYAADIPNMAVAFVTSSRWLQVIAPGQSLETTDSGKSWHPYASDYSQAAPVTPEVIFTDASVGYATVRGEILRTLDGGSHWTRIQTPGT